MKILSRPKGNAEEYGRWSVNPYVGCSNNCSYCYLKSGPSAKVLGGNVPKLKKGVVSEDHAYHLAMAEIVENKDQIIKDGGLFMTFTSDPFLLETFKLFCRIAVSAEEMGIPVTILTKSGVVPTINLFLDETIPIQRLVGKKYTKEVFGEVFKITRKKAILTSVGFTLTGHDELEPRAHSNEERISAIKYLKEKGSYSEGCHVWASIEPIIDFPSSLDMVKKAADAGCEHFKIGLLTKNTKPCREKYDVEECIDFITKVMTLTSGKATVYWKQSVREFIRTCRKPALTDDELRKVFDTWPNSVSKDYSMFTSNDYGK